MNQAVSSRSREVSLLRLLAAALFLCPLLPTKAFALVPFPFAAAPWPQEVAEPAIPVGSSPSTVAVGENWVIVGSTEVIPEDYLVYTANDSVTVNEVVRLSERALGDHPIPFRINPTRADIAMD